MSLTRLDIFNIRNIRRASLNPSQNNLIFGNNGAGKTSVLEAIYLLSNGKTFRAGAMENLISHGQEECIVSGKWDDKSIGIERHKSGLIKMRVNSQNVKRVSELSRIIPVHIIDPNAIELVEGSPNERRRFLDFTMFHVEHSYLEVLKNFQNALKQRNALLKQILTDRAKLKDLEYWDNLYVGYAVALNRMRHETFYDVLVPWIKEVTDYLLPEFEISTTLIDGCKEYREEEDFRKELNRSRDQDLKYKSTQLGPHRADIILKYKGKLAKDYLSRGQKKLLTYGVRLAPAMMLKKKKYEIGQILIDDMPSELDVNSVEKICQVLLQIEGQNTLTAVDRSNSQTQVICHYLRPTMFHVEHGGLEAIQS